MGWNVNYDCDWISIHFQGVHSLNSSKIINKPSRETEKKKQRKLKDGEKKRTNQKCPDGNSRKLWDKSPVLSETFVSVFLFILGLVSPSIIFCRPATLAWSDLVVNCLVDLTGGKWQQFDEEETDRCHLICSSRLKWWAGRQQSWAFFLALNRREAFAPDPFTRKLHKWINKSTSYPLRFCFKFV